MESIVTEFWSDFLKNLDFWGVLFFGLLDFSRFLDRVREGSSPPRTGSYARVSDPTDLPARAQKKQSLSMTTDVMP
jgi:hypothetical protein